MVLSFNNDDKNVGTMSERVFAGRDSLSVKLLRCMHIHDDFHWNTLNYVKKSISYCCFVAYLSLILIGRRMNANTLSILL